MSLTPGQRVRGTWAMEKSIALILRIRPALYAVLAGMAGVVVGWMFGGKDEGKET